ncbi:hypothetical protein FOZ60_007077 [Perkinsus olseni]|uniref:Uncharacterized protein n=1 Tax=Perkinsus olseni TaxID=32597 RepID=A0A7J6NM92_PEROL|nr:hypothetical protein FOZ60_007077 [Perkinsus olseni]
MACTARMHKKRSAHNEQQRGKYLPPYGVSSWNRVQVTFYPAHHNSLTWGHTLSNGTRSHRPIGFFADAP